MVAIKDLVELMRLCLESDVPGGVYNVGCGQPISIEDQIKLIAEVFNSDKKSDIIYCPEKGSSPQFVLSIDKAQSELGYEPKYDFRKLLLDYKWYLENEPFEAIMGKRSDFIE